jgi:hypothetical protein
MTCNFRVGKNVVCQMMDQAGAFHGIREGDTYEVESIKDNFIRLKGFEGGWYSYRFSAEKASPASSQAITPSKEKVETAP